jgi:acyl carrier protein
VTGTPCNGEAAVHGARIRGKEGFSGKETVRPCPCRDHSKEENFMTLEEKVIGIIMEQLDVTREECVPEASFIDDLGADSLDLVEMIMEMEETFDVQIADNDLEKIRTIKDVLDYLKNKGVTWHE